MTNLIRIHAIVGVLALSGSCVESSVVGPHEAFARHVAVSANGMAGWTLIATGKAGVSQAVIARAIERSGARPGDQFLDEPGVRLQVGTGPTEGALLRTEQYRGAPLASLSALSFSTFVRTRPSSRATPVLIIAVDLNNDGYVDDRLMYRPSPDLRQWETWDALHGAWLSRSSIGHPDAQGMRTLAAYSAAAPSARLIGDIKIGAWRVGGSERLSANVDNVTIGVGEKTTVFHFKNR